MDERRFISILAIAVIGYSIWQSRHDVAVSEARAQVAESRLAVRDSSPRNEAGAGCEIVPVGDSAVYVNSATGETWLLRESLEAWVPLKRLSAGEAESLTELDQQPGIGEQHR